MTENREQKHDGYTLHTAGVILGLRSRQTLTKKEQQALEDTKVIVAMLRQKTDGGSLPDEPRPPGPLLKKDGDEADTASSTDEKNNSLNSAERDISNISEDGTGKNNSQNSALANALKVLHETA